MLVTLIGTISVVPCGQKSNLNVEERLRGLKIKTRKTTDHVPKFLRVGVFVLFSLVWFFPPNREQ